MRDSRLNCIKPAPGYRVLPPLDSKHPLVSVIMFCRNRVKLIQRAVESVLNQTYTNWELIIQDGASTDGTREAIESYKDPRIKLRSEVDDGPFDAMWRAYRRCVGEITGSCLSDEELLPNALSEGVNYLYCYPETAAIVRDLYLISPEGHIIRRYDASEFNFFDYLSINSPLALQTVLFRQTALLEIGLLTRNWRTDCADFELLTHLGRHYRVDCYPGLVGRYCQHHESQLSTTPAIGYFCAVGQLQFINDYFAGDSTLNLLRSFPLTLAHGAISRLYRMKEASEYEQKLDTYFRSLNVRDVGDLIETAHQAIGIGKLTLAHSILSSIPDESPQRLTASRLLAELFELLFQPEEAMKQWSDLANHGNMEAAERFLNSQLNVPTVTAVQILANQKKWGTQLSPMQRQHELAGGEKPRKPRLAFHASDWSAWKVRHQVLPWLPFLDSKHYEILCLVDADAAVPSLPPFIKTEILPGVSPAEILKVLRALRIDSLVELSAFEPGHLLPILVNRVARAQFTYLGQMATSGLHQIDYQLADDIICPPALARFHTETVVRFPECYAFFGNGGMPCAKTSNPLEVPVDGISSHNRRLDARFTYACFASNSRINHKLLDCWARLLILSPGTRLILANQTFCYSDCRSELQRVFRQYQVPHESLLLLPSKGDLPYELFPQIDLYLDTFPHSHAEGVVASLVRGIPSVTLLGSTMAGRLGASLLRAADLPQFVATTVEEYAVLAHALSKKRVDLSQLKTTVPHTLQERGLLDPIRFAEKFYKTITACTPNPG